jgi:hypothetical protein
MKDANQLCLAFLIQNQLLNRHLPVWLHSCKAVVAQQITDVDVHLVCAESCIWWSDWFWDRFGCFFHMNRMEVDYPYEARRVLQTNF